MLFLLSGLQNKRKVFARFLLSGLIAGIYFNSGSDAAAQQSPKGNAINSGQKPVARKTTQFTTSNWNLNCQPQPGGKKLTCVLSKSVFVATSRKVFVTVSIRSTPVKTEPYIITARLPHGLALAAGVQFQIDKQKPGKLVLYTSSEQGVFARVGLINELLSSLQKGKQLKIMFSARNGRKIIVPMSLQGFAAGFEKLK